uniref:Uncharacterized protein n=1 Tax=Caenorhabditis japonica TaxID=281687 RepID=A0A8R1HWB8_CAEJA
MSSPSPEVSSTESPIETREPSIEKEEFQFTPDDVPNKRKESDEEVSGEEESGGSKTTETFEVTSTVGESAMQTSKNSETPELTDASELVAESTGTPSEAIDLTIKTANDAVDSVTKTEKSEQLDQTAEECDLSIKPETMDVDQHEFAIPELPVKDEKPDPAVGRLRREAKAQMKVYQKYFDDLNLVYKASQQNISKFKRSCLLKQVNANNFHIDGYRTRIETAQTTDQLQTLLDEIRLQNLRARQSQEINDLLGEPY